LHYPVWDLPFAHGLLIAIVAVLHVFVSHIAVGGGLYLVLTEWLARRRGDAELLDIVRLHSRVFLLLSLVFGAMTGVGIWFTIGLINPTGTSALIHTFVWGWAVEWCFFLVEIIAALVYVYGWERMDARRHLAVGWIYFVAAWLSLVVINGIISFQLTPGEWVLTRSFADGFFNPTYWSSLVIRSFWAVGLAGLFGLWTATRSDASGHRAWLQRYSALWALIGIALAALSTLWWWRNVPEAARLLTRGNMPIATVVTHWTPIAVAVLAAVIVVGPLLMPRRSGRPVTVLILAIALVCFGLGEWVREGVRKPWIVTDYLYVHGLRAEEIDAMRAEGIRANALWARPVATTDSLALGADAYRLSCQNCHARDGYNGLASRVGRWETEYTTAMIERLGSMRRPMPPFIGTAAEARSLALYLHSLPGVASVPPLPADGRQAYERRCAPCHSIGGFRDLGELVEGLNAEDLADFMADMESDTMPPFTGSDEERQLLAQWLADNVANRNAEASP
jgi:mono/diheme cytochrome c family protein/cytochrome bd-type quinol oxidase subunit 1